MIANPEFERNVWIECTRLRLLAAIAAPVLIFLLVVNSTGWRTGLFIVAHYIILMAVAFWGARKSADAVAGEIRDRTWDQQRLSGLGPAAMTIGKVFGAPSLVWVVIAVCVFAQAIALASGGSEDPINQLLFGYAIGWWAILAEIAGAFMVFAASFFAGLMALNGQERPRAFDATLFQLAGVLSGMTVILVMGLSNVIVAAQSEFGAIEQDRFDASAFEIFGMVRWWGLVAPAPAALALSFLVFALWALYGGVHQMRRAFAMRTTALGWIGFLGFLAVFLSGWAPGYWALAAAVGVAIAVYAAALFEPHRLVVYRDWFRRLSGGDVAALVSGPAWLYAWILGAALAWTAFSRSELDWVALGDDVARYFSPQAAIIAAMLFVLRDVGVCVWAGLRAADGRGLWTAVLILVVLHVLIGPLLASFMEASAFQLFFPLNATSTISAAAQAAIAWTLVGREMAAPVRGPAPAQG